MQPRGGFSRRVPHQRMGALAEQGRNLCVSARLHISRRAAKALARAHERERKHQMKKFLGPVVLAAGLFMVSSIAEAACVTTRNGIRSTTVCNGVVTKRYGNRSVTYGTRPWYY